MSGLLEVAELSVRYRTPYGPLPAVADAGLTIRRGEIVAVIGESGSGKSTLAKALLGLLPATAEVTAGSARFVDGGETVELLRRSDRELRSLRWRRIAYVAQGSISAFNPLLRIRAHFQDTAAAHGVPARAIEEPAHHLLQAVRLEPGPVLDAYPHELSGGMRQRVAIALALVLEPTFVVLDEPTTALDVITQREVLDIVAALRDETGVSMLLVSHDLGVASYVADRVVTMYAGRVVEDAPVEALLARPLHPYSDGLLRAVPSLEAAEPVSAIPGNPPNLLDLPGGCPFHPRCPAALPECRAGRPPRLLAQPTARRVACLLHEDDVA